MFRVKHYFSIRIVSLLLAIAMIVGVVPVTVIGAINENGNSATIDVLVEGGIVDGDVVVFEDCVINWSPADPSVGRYQDGWWVGIKVTAPSVLDIENATYQNKTSDGWGVVKSFKTYRDSTDDSATQFITLWGMVNEQYLTDAIINGKEFLNYGYRFNWDGVGDYDQEITMKINPKDIILNKNGAQLYPNVAGSGAIATITDGLSVSNNGGNIAVVENKSNIVLNWTEANAEIGRNQDGWWVGFNVTAPDYADLEKATYQYKTSTGWDSEVHSFVPDSGKTLQVWRLLNENYLSNAISANKNVNYITRYDWDGDGVYEQIVHLKVDPRKVELMKDGERVYPQSGAVTPLTGGIVIGSAPNFELRIEETTLNWSAKDESIGRLVDGWWVGFKVTAPDGYTVEQLDSGFYYKRATSSIAESGWGEYQKTYFKDTKDSDREVTLWMVINPSLLEKYEGIGRNICTEYIFDWDGTGNNVQTITLAVVPSEKIVLNKVEQSNFGFVEPNPVDKWVGDTYTNEAVGGQGTGEITYSIEEGFDVADIDSSTGTLTFKKVGTVVVTATKAADDTYKQVSATYTVNAIKYSQSEFKFENSNGNITVEFAEGEYINKAIGGSGDGDVKYSIVSGELVATIDENTGKITFLKAGDVTVVATKLADDKYFETTATYTLTIAKSNQQTLEFENDIPASITYSTDSIKNLFDVIGGSGEGKLVYTIVDGVDYAKIDKDSGAITLLKAGGSFTVQVIKEGDSGYNESAAISAEIRVEYADQKGFVFENQIENSITFNDNDNVFENSAIGGQGNGIVKYAFADEESANIADIDENTGKITIKASGVIKVIASKAGDDCYKEASAAYTLVVEKDDPEFSVENVTLIYGTTEYQITVNSTLVGSGKYAYEIIEENSIGAAVDSDGKITFTNSEAKVGTIKVSVTKEEDNQYKSGTYVFEVSVEYHQPEKKPEISGSTKNESGWFDGEVTITAPDGYTIGLSNDLEGTVWHETVTLCTDGIHLPGVYLKKGNEISDVFTFGDVKIDKAAPINLSIEYEESFFIKFIQLVTFGIFESEGINVKLSALDETSGIDYITYTIGGEDVIVSKDQFDTNENGEIEYNFQIQPQFRDEISFTATDVAGWTSEITSSGMILLVDNISPDLQCAWNFTDEQNNLYNNIYYTQGKTTVKFTITEANFDLSLELAQDETKAPAPIITVNQVEQNVTWSKVEGTDEYEAEIMLTECGDYEIAISYTDRSGNAMETYSQKLHIDDVAPIVEVTYDNNEARNENHYNADRTATIKVTEHNFESQNITLDVTAKDINGVSINISEKKYAEYVQDIVNWKQDGDVWTLNTEGMKFDADAVYNITLNYVDLAGNVAEAYSTEFVVDKTAPANVQIEYSESIVDKVLTALTFGFYDAEVTVTVTVVDYTSGIESLEITYTKEEGTSTKNKDTYSVTYTADNPDENLRFVQEGNKFTAKHNIGANARGLVSVKVVDKAANTFGVTENKILVVDNIVPGLQYEWSFTDGQVNSYNNIYYTQGETSVKFTVDEANFDLGLEVGEDETKAPAPVITVNQEEQNVTWSKVEGTDEYEAEIMLTECGDYEIAISYTDRSGNAMETYSQKLHIDDVAPVIEVTYDNNEARNENHYKADRTATIKVTEHNFKPKDIVLDVTAKDINGEIIDISEKNYAEYVQDIVNWKQDGDVWTLDTEGMEFDADAVYNITLNYVDLAGNVAEEYSTEFVVDKTAPANVQIEYSESIVDKLLTALTFGFYNAEVTVTVTVEDYTSGIESLEITYTKEEGTSDNNKNTYSVTYTADNSDENLRFVQEGNKFTAKHTIDANARGNISVSVTDKAGNVTNESEDNHRIVVDNIAPQISVTYEANSEDTKVQFTDNDLNTVSSLKEATHIYYNGDVTAKIVIDEANFFEGIEAEDGVIHSVGIKLTKTDNAGVQTVFEYLPNGAAQMYEGATPVYITWTTEGDLHSFDIKYSDDADYVLEIEYVDFSQNESQISANDTENFEDVNYSAIKFYQSKVLTVDKKIPVIEVTYDNNEARNGNHYKADRTATIKVTEHNFKPKDIVLYVTAEDINGESINISEKKYAEYAKDIVNWKQDGDVWTLDTEGMKFDADAVYNITLNYVDLAGNVAEEYSTEFVVDKTAPANVQIEYSESIVDKVLTALTFGFYNAEVTVTVTVEDYTSGIESLEITYTKEEGTSDKNKDTYSVTYTADNPDENLRFVQEGNKFTAKHTIDANARGNISVSVTDKAGNVTNESEDNHRIVVDNIAPQISVTYEANSEDTKVQFTDNDFNTVSNLKEATHIYYNGDVTAKIVIDEANFFEGIEAEDGVIHSVGIKLTKTDNAGVQTVFEYLPNGAAQMYEGATPVYITWKTNGDLHSFDIEYSDDADYVLEIEYVDFSQNTATKNEKVSEAQNEVYQTRTITVDKIAPVVEVVYSNEAIINTVYDRDYFDAHQTATITVVEHNFRANDFNASVIAKDVLGNDVVVEDFESTLSNDERWQHNGDIHTITISYTVDANYSFDYELIDLAQNAAAEYETDLFTVDTTAPENLTISYSQSFADKVLEAITFGYYNAKVTVTITAEDSTSGIYRFEYSYLKSAGVSSVNAELLNAAIEQANIESEGTKYIATFEIPKEVLNSRNQFNGTVKFTAFDCSENNTEEADTRRVIVDNITPVATITYNEPVQTVDNISYYAGNIDAKIEINEANFFKQDVVVKVNDEVIDVKWTDNSVDVHTGTFTLTEDGDYIVTVEYTDRSGNKMNKYTSNQLTVDTVAPTVSVTNIKNNSANKDEQYGFTVTLKDVNLDAASIEAILTAVVKDENSGYAIEKVSLGEMTTVDEGKHYTFTVENLEADAVYTLVCSLNDMSLNKYSKIMLDDGKEYDEVKFSINRNGSAFDVDDNTAALVEQYYVYNVENDVVIVEVNVDPVENYTVKLNGEVLTEGTDFTTSLSNVVGEWSKRTYVLSKSLFDSEGEYTVVIESIDKAQSSAYSDVKNLNVSFVVDRTAPVITISGIETGGRYQVDEQLVTIIPTDDGGKLHSLIITVFDSDGSALKDAAGNDISVRFDMSGDELLEYLTQNEGKVTFTIPQGLENNIQIVCNDCAAGSNGKTNELVQTFTEVTVSQSGWIIFYANKALFYGSIAGIVVLIGVIVFLIVYKKKKKVSGK